MIDIHFGDIIRTEWREGPSFALALAPMEDSPDGWWNVLILNDPGGAWHSGQVVSYSHSAANSKVIECLVGRRNVE